MNNYNNPISRNIIFSPVGRNDLDSYELTIPFDWSKDPYLDNNWCFQLHTLRCLSDFITKFLKSRDYIFLEIALDWLSDWWKFNSTKPAPYAWYDMATGIRSEKIYQISKAISSTEKKLPSWLKEMILEHIKVMRSPGFIRTDHNHGLYVIHGLRCLADLVGPGMKENILKKIHLDFEKLLNSQFDENFVHLEHSPHYHHLTLNALIRYKKTGLYDNFLTLNNYIEGATQVARYLYLPDGREVPFGDTDNKKSSKINNFINKIDSEHTVFNKSGYFCFAKKNSYLFSINSYNSKTHKHEDNLSFVFGINGRDVFIDPGKYKYINNSIRSRITSSLAHNVINFKKKPWSLNNINKGTGQFFYHLENDLLLTKSNLELRYGSEKVFWERLFIYKTDEYLGIFDLVENAPSETYSKFVLNKYFSISSDSENLISHRNEEFVINFISKSYNKEKNGFKDNKFKVVNEKASFSYGSFDEVESIEIEIGKASLTIFSFIKEKPVEDIFQNCEKFLEEYRPLF